MLKPKYMKIRFLPGVMDMIYGKNDIYLILIKYRYVFVQKKTSKNLKGISDISSGPCVEFDKRIGMFKGPEVFFSKRIKEILRDDIKENETDNYKTWRENT